MEIPYMSRGKDPPNVIQHLRTNSITGKRGYRISAAIFSLD